MKVEVLGNIKGIRREFARDEETGELTEITTFKVVSDDLPVSDIRQLVAGLPGKLYARVTIESPQAELPIDGGAE